MLSVCDVLKSIGLNIFRAIGWRDGRWLKIKECRWQGGPSAMVWVSEV